MSDQSVPRVVTDVNGPWQVVHPFTGEVEFTTADRDFAEAVCGVLDERDPVGMKWLYEALYAVPPQVRRMAEWVMSTGTFTRLRQIQARDDRYLWELTVMADAPDALLGKPVRIDESAVGISLQDADRSHRA